MTLRNTFRARGTAARTGGRSPQISDGLFEGRTAPPNTIKPTAFTALAYAPDTSPSVELWCYRLGQFDQAGVWQPPATGQPFQQITRAGGTLWLDQVLQAEEFVPPTGAKVDEPETIQAFKDYASQRWASAYFPLADDPDDWVVTVSRPYQAPSGTDQTKFEPDVVYAIHQHPVPGSGMEHLTGYLWTPLDELNGGKPAGRELWLHYMPNQPGGFGIIGDIPVGEPSTYSSTRLRFTEWKPGEDEYLAWSIYAYESTVQLLKEHCMNHQDNPAATPEELELLDYRVGDQQ